MNGGADLAAAKAKLSAALKAWNGSPAADLPPGREEVKALLERLEREDAEAARQEAAEPLVAALGRLEAGISQLVEQGRPRLIRSGMSAAEKSGYIRTHGKAAYDALPWE